MIVHYHLVKLCGFRLKTSQLTSVNSRSRPVKTAQLLHNNEFILIRDSGYYARLRSGLVSFDKKIQRVCSCIGKNK